LTFESDVTAPTFVCHAVEGSADLTRAQLKTYQALRVAKAMAFEQPLPWTPLDLYDWLAATAKGVRVRGDITSGSCCAPAGVPSIALDSSSAALQNDGW